MKPSPCALSLLLIASSSNAAFVSNVNHVSTNPRIFGSGNVANLISAPVSVSSFRTANNSISHSHSSSLYAGFLGQDDIADNESETKEYEQSMSSSERDENLTVMRQIFKHDLADLQRRRDYAGWVEAKKDLKRRTANDPWFGLNNKLKEAIQIDAPTSEIDELQKLIKQVGGPPPGITHKRPYAVLNEIYDTGMSLGRAEAIVEMEQKKVNHARWQKMIAEREANEKQEEEERRLNPFKDEEEARARREKTLRRIYNDAEAERKKKEKRAKEIQQQYGVDDSSGGLTPLDKAIEDAKKELQAAKSDDSALSSDDGKKAISASSSAPEKKGRPRIAGDTDMTRGEIEIETMDSSDVTTNNVRVVVTASYNAGQSDPPMRKHCFTYNIQITNLSDTDTIQLVSRKFEIQTVGARQKDVVQGQGVTGRQPVLAPGEVFEYTSTAPLSVRPIGTTIVAARMKGEYEFNIIEKPADEESTDKEDVKVLSGPLTADLGLFHFIFPVEQRVKPVSQADDDDDDEEDEPEPEPAAPAKPTAAASSPASAAATPSLPGDADMTSGQITEEVSSESETSTEGVRVKVSSQYREERSDPKLEKHCFAYNIRITNENDMPIQLISRKFEIQTIGSKNKDVVQGPGVTGRQPVLQPGESFEYTSTAPLSVRPLPSTAVVARMQGAYAFMRLGKDNTPLSSTPLQAELAKFHFILPALDLA